MKITAQVIDQLFPGERLELIERLWDSLTDGQVPLHPAVQVELERRLAAYDQDRAAALPWEDIKARLLRES